MHFLSTRGQDSVDSFSDALIDGLASDGGLYVPTSWPQITRDELTHWKDFSYADLATEVMAKFMVKIPKEAVSEVARLAYSSEVFSHVRKDSQSSVIFPIRRLEDGLYLLELSNGPTLAFKDAAMQVLARLMSYVLEERNETMTILGATSGDTGSAVIHAFRGREKIKVVMLSPKGRMSPFQRAQMYAFFDDNILNVAVRGGFDECQDLVKAIKSDRPFKAKHHIGTANSINFGRIAAQCCYYVFAYIHVAKEIGDPVSFSVPTGNFGNAYSGLVAKMMGVPIKNIVITTNENDVLHRVMTTGIYEPAESSMTTSSPSMDIAKASNFERIVYEAADQNGKIVGEMWQRLREEGRIDIKGDYPEVWAKLQTVGLVSAENDHAGRMELMRQSKADWNLVMDPHTADGLRGALTHRKENEAMVVLETAQPAKFAATIQEALGEEPETPEGFGDILSLPQRFETINNSAEDLKGMIDWWAEGL